MQNIFAEMAKTTAENSAPGATSARHDGLDQRYRQIGIPAVAAAVRYQGLAKNPAYAPVASNWGLWRRGRLAAPAPPGQNWPKGERESSFVLELTRIVARAQ